MPGCVPRSELFAQRAARVDFLEPDGRPLRKLVTAARIIRQRPYQFWPLVRRNLFLSKAEPERADRYAKWIACHERSGERTAFASASGGPVISVLVIATRSRASMVSATLRSLEEQSLTAWQLVLGRLDLSEVETAALVPDGRRDGRIVLAPKGGATLGAALRRAADAATGDFVMVLDPGDTLPQHAIATIAARLHGDSSIDILYADEDVLDDGVRTSPQFKPEWSPELLTAYNYFGRPTVIRRRILHDVDRLHRISVRRRNGICTCGRRVRSATSYLHRAFDATLKFSVIATRFRETAVQGPRIRLRVVFARRWCAIGDARGLTRR